MFSKHPKGLAPLFFTEMWERLAFYLLVGILVVYASDSETGGLGLTSDEANAIYGTYMAFVYFTPFPGGMIADRLLGYRKSVLIGGVFFAVGLFLLGLPGMTFFYTGLTLLCVGNGLFKPNISAMVGNLYEKGDPNRDTGFNIFYMGINIGAAVANLIAAPIRNQISWSWTFWAASIGICIGIVILLANWKKLERADRRPVRTADDTPTGEIFGQIFVPALVLGLAAFALHKGFLGPYLPSAISAQMLGFLCGMIPVIVFFLRMPGKAPVAERAGLAALLPVFVAGGTFFMVLHLNGSALTVWAKDNSNREVAAVPDFWSGNALPSYFGNAAPSVPRPREESLEPVDEVLEKAFGTKNLDETRAATLAALPGIRSVTLWSADGAALPPDAAELDRNWRPFSSPVYRDSDIATTVTEAEGKKNVKVTLANGAHPLRRVLFLRDIEGKPTPVFFLSAGKRDAVYAKAGPERLAPGTYLKVVNPEIYQSWNAIFVILFTPIVVAFFAMRSRKGKAITTPRKLVYGMLLTMASMLVMAIAGWVYESSGTKVAGLWLVMAYAVITVGELCLSPMGLSLVTKLSPKRLVGLMMGGWFCATAFGNKLSGFFGEIQDDLSPSTFFLVLVGAALLVAGFLWSQLGKLEKTMADYKA
ncbi:MAG: peptide MFS transporter [Planctomycetes bacterium]|nr:peptide MFS transporter [Planctomycetota bacterium]